MTECVSIRGVPLYLFDHEAVCDAIRAAGYWYEGELLDELLVRRPQESVVIDAGAHIGNHSTYWSEFLPYERLYAFEPMPETYDVLRLNLARFPNARTLPLALSDIPGPLVMERDTVNRGRSRVSASGTVPAHAVRLDDLGIVGVSFIKLDVEGWHEHVLRGAARTLAASHPALLVEDEGGIVGDTLASLGLHGYRCVREWPKCNFLWEWT